MRTEVRSHSASRMGLRHLVTTASSSRARRGDDIELSKFVGTQAPNVPTRRPEAVLENLV